MDGAKAEQILDTILEGPINFDGKIWLQISSNGTNVNLKFLDLYKNKRYLEERQTLADIGTYGLHTVTET